MSNPNRILPTGLVTELQSTYTRPFRAVALTIGGTNYYFSEGPAITFGGHSYVASRVKVSAVQFQDNAKQAANVTIFSTQGNTEAEDFFLNNQLVEVPVDIYQVYQKADNSFTTPLLYIRGTCSGASMDENNTSVTLTVELFRAGAAFTPNRYFSVAEGFHYLPPENSIIYWNGTKYTLQGEIDT
jgi:hypothetical protein